MASEEDNFDIDIYGDGGEDYQQHEPAAEVKPEEWSDQFMQPVEAAPQATSQPSSNEITANPDTKLEIGLDDKAPVQKIGSTDNSAPDPVHLPKHAPQTQGLKRKDGADDRHVDPGATTALFVTDLHWWVNDDDMRGWANQSQCEDELEEITFSEHKVNGKSKGQAYVLFKSPQAATAAKQKIESFGDGQQYSKKFTVSYTNPYSNPFRTLPKDGPMRNNAPASNNRSTSGAYGGTGAGGMSGTPQHHGGFNNSSSGGYRGNRGGGYNPRGGSGPGYNRGGFHQPATGGYGSNMGGFQMGGMQSYGAFQNRGAMMGAVRGGAIGIRGGRGGVAPNGMMGMPMAGMGMGAMGGMGMSMPQMGGGIGIQGMQRFYNSPPVNAVGRYGSSANPVGLFPPAQPPANQHPPVASAASPLLRGGLNPPTNVAPGSAWANYTQYSSSPASNPPASFPSHAAAPGTAITPAQPSSALKRKSSLTGNQTHYNPAFFAQQQQGQHNGATGDVNWNPHGAKRTRQE